MDKPVVVIEESDSTKFENKCADCIAMGYKLSSASCGFVNSESYEFCSSYQAILVKEDD